MISVLPTRIRFYIQHDGQEYEVLFVVSRATVYLFLNTKELFSAEMICDNMTTAQMVLQAYLLARMNPDEQTIKTQQ